MRTQADELVRWFYNFLKKRMEPKALDTLIKQGLRARGSKSVNGFMRMLADLHGSESNSKPQFKNTQEFQVANRRSMQEEMDKK